MRKSKKRGNKRDSSGHRQDSSSKDSGSTSKSPVKNEPSTSTAANVRLATENKERQNVLEDFSKLSVSEKKIQDDNKQSETSRKKEKQYQQFKPSFSNQQQQSPRTLDPQQKGQWGPQKQQRPSQHQQKAPLRQSQERPPQIQSQQKAQWMPSPQKAQWIQSPQKTSMNPELIQQQTKKQQERPPLGQSPKKSAWDQSPQKTRGMEKKNQSIKQSLSTSVSGPWGKDEAKLIELYGSKDVNLDRGKIGRKIRIEANYLKLILDKMIDSAYHYDIKFIEEKPRRFIRPAFEEYCRQVDLPKQLTLAFDGRSNVFSPVKLDEKYLKSIKVNVHDEFSSSAEILVTLSETSSLCVDLKCLKEDYRVLPMSEKPMRALAVLDVILRSPCYGRSVQAGRAFYNQPYTPIDLTEGYELWYGLFQATVLGEQPLLNIDICHRSFPSGKDVLDILENIDIRNPVDFRYALNPRIKNKLSSLLKGTSVIYTPPKIFGKTPKRRRVNEVLGSSASTMFTNEQNRKLSVADYYKEQGYPLKYPNMPCLWVGGRNHNIYIPVEFISVEAGQVSLKKAGQQQVRFMIKDAATTTTVRKEKTLKEFKRFNHNDDPTIQAFKINIDPNFIELEGRVIDAPTLRYSNGTCESRDGSWDPSRRNLTYVEGSQATRCAILILDNNMNAKAAKDFADHLKKGEMGVYLEFYCAPRKVDARYLDNYFREFKDEKVELVFVILPPFPDNYSIVKQLAETKYGILTQCIKSETILKKCNISTIQNILLKINAKLNGANHFISVGNRQRYKNLLDTKDVMLIGADVTHPSPEQKKIPSVVGVAASHDLNCVKYNIQYRLQDPKKEIIQNMDDILYAHLLKYQNMNKTLPNKIIYYRDGVSDGQFADVKHEELQAMDRACAKFRQNNGQYRPAITCVIVQKRHRTRFFPNRQDQVGKYQNVPPGTIVDTVITHPKACQFFMVSHQSIQGTAKPTKYVVIRDDYKYNIDDLQALTNNLCHIFTRCNRAVSYPAPAYYAHLVAYRGRVYIERETLNLNDLDCEYEKRRIKNLDDTNPMFFV